MKLEKIKQFGYDMGLDSKKIENDMIYQAELELNKNKQDQRLSIKKEAT